MPITPEIEEARDVAGQFVVVFAVTAFEVHGDRRVDGRGDPPDDLLGERDRNRLSVAIALGFGDGPAAGGDRLCAGREDGLGAACIPRVVE